MSGPVANNIFKASGVIAAAAGGLNWDSTVLTALTNLTVTVQNAGGNKYFIGGVQQQTLNLLEGFTYKFDQSDSSNSGHPFRFSTTSGGTHSGGSEYTTGVTTSGTPGNAGAYTQIVVATSAPLLYYYCTNHNYMGGTANTVSETVEANRGYWIDTTSTTCTITLPSSPSKGDQIILVDYARTWGTNKITINPGSSNYQGQDNSYTIEYSTSGEVLNIVYSDGTKGWIPQDDDEVADVPVAPAVQRAIFAFGFTGSVTNISNLVNSSGGVGSDVGGVGTSRRWTGATNYGGDKAIFAYGHNNSAVVSMSNLVNNSGVVAADVTGVGTARQQLEATTYGSSGQALFAYGDTGSRSSLSNKISSSGVVASDTTGVGTARSNLGSAPYGGDKGIFAFGDMGSGYTAVSNLVNNTGVISSDVSAVGTARQLLAGAPYGGDKAIMAYGNVSGTQNMKNLVSNQGVVSSDAAGVGTARDGMGAAGYGTDKAIFAYGGQTGSSLVNTINLVNNSGVVASDSTGTGTARTWTSAAAYSFSA